MTTDSPGRQPGYSQPLPARNGRATLSPVGLASFADGATDVVTAALAMPGHGRAIIGRLASAELERAGRRR
jgi:hypothetical protein